MTNHSSTRDSGFDCGNGFYASFNHLPTSTACWCLSLGLVPALELLSMAAPGSLPGTHSQNCHPEQWVMDDKCASYFISIGESSELHFIRYLKSFDQIERCILICAFLPCFTLLSLTPASWGHSWINCLHASFCLMFCFKMIARLLYYTKYLCFFSAALSTGELLWAEQNILGVGVVQGGGSGGREGRCGEGLEGEIWGLCCKNEISLKWFMLKIHVNFALFTIFPRMF